MASRAFLFSPDLIRYNTLMAETQIVTGDGGPAGQKPVETPAAPPAASASTPSEGTISWTASEFVAHEKSPGWYGILVLVSVIIAALIYLITRDIISTAVVIIAALAFAVLAGRKPKQLQYQLSNAGMTIGNKQFGYNMFKSFSVVPEGAFSSIVFRPLKRFSPLTTIYYAPDDEEKIIILLSDHLPFEEHKPDPIDNMMRRIRF
jgi:hypothetical protein